MTEPTRQEKAQLQPVAEALEEEIRSGMYSIQEQAWELSRAWAGQPLHSEHSPPVMRALLHYLEANRSQPWTQWYWSAQRPQASDPAPPAAGRTTDQAATTAETEA